MCESLCWSCAKYNKKCCWSKSFKPVKGWEAEKRTLDDNTKSYFVFDCPEFKQDFTLVSIPIRRIEKMLNLGRNNAKYFTEEFIITKLKRKYNLDIIYTKSMTRRIFYRRIYNG